MKNWFFSSLGLMLVIEGLMPLFFPQGWRDTFKKLITMKSGQIRFMGLVSFLLGLIFIFLGR
ncbi:DUF2065 domain-containing protein [Candidatus Methylopumilus rimovensis]|jgi:uncharacterized protein YjeT (DUF2065 family)|uniref:DUF2065 domain-containing protein n=1 Tax=Candidatus Methylopumilus rimovensis TaxID=2588535 RepID=UPI00111CDC7E|nr:DUF2065 domain-containing protein [Candidatus Methylopumilus rimovensis]QDD12104.1 DUF2065 domain-containing protein [Candidatus Methylopumilus rimovensis]